jgi:hypothetical protein
MQQFTRVVGAVLLYSQRYSWKCQGLGKPQAKEIIMQCVGCHWKVVGVTFPYRPAPTAARWQVQG